jgi:hypothetical protein
MSQKLPILLLDRLLLGRPITADVVARSEDEREDLGIPPSEHTARVSVYPYWDRGPRGHVPADRFRVYYRVITEEALRYEDPSSLYEEEVEVTGVTELERTLARYVRDFGAFWVGDGVERA